MSTATATATAAPAAAAGRGAVTAEALARFERAEQRCQTMAAAAGVLNATHGHLVEVAIACQSDGDHVGPGLHSLGQYLAWRLGVAPSTAKALALLARRAEELPTLCATLRAGEISLDQAEVVARNVPASFDRSATELAKVCTVAQLRQVLPHYRERTTSDRRSTHVSITTNDDGTARISGVLDADQATLIEQALAAMRDDLLRQRKEDARSFAEETGEEPGRVRRPNGAEALTALAETALQAGEAAHPGADRYLISYHLQATEDGRLLLVDDRGLVVDEAERRRILCDHQFEGVLHDDQGTPLSVGRRTRQISGRLRRAILHRHHGRCAVPGCTATLGLEVHHIVHWEDGGRTDTANLVPLCRHHHRAHHHGDLPIHGNADHGTVTIGPPERHLPTVGTPHHVEPSAGNQIEHLRRQARHRLRVQPPPHATTPLGERLDRHGFSLSPDPPHAPPAP